MKDLSAPPAWFKFHTREQEDIVSSMQQNHRDIDAFQHSYIQKAKADAMPMVAKIVTDLASRSDAFLTGNVRIWGNGVRERVERNRMKKRNPLKYVWVFCILPILKNEHAGS